MSKDSCDSVDPIRSRFNPWSNVSLDMVVRLDFFEPNPHMHGMQHMHACMHGRLQNLFIANMQFEHFFKLRPFADFCARFADFCARIADQVFSKITVKEPKSAKLALKVL